jgi:YggT family protein
MGPNVNNALYFLINTLFELYLWLLILRIMLQVVRGDFFNPISQLVWKLTQPPVAPLAAVVPRFRGVDLPAVIVLLVIAYIHVEVAWWLQSRNFGMGYTAYSSLLKLVVLTLNLYTFTVFVQAVLSWIGPGVNNPAGSVLWSLNEPLLRPVRRLIPPISGLDLSPLLLILALQFVSRVVPLDFSLR